MKSSGQVATTPLLGGELLAMARDVLQLSGTVGWIIGRMGRGLLDVWLELLMASSKNISHRLGGQWAVVTVCSVGRQAAAGFSRRGLVVGL